MDDIDGLCRLLIRPRKILGVPTRREPPATLATSLA
jgi:hypothetical protein